MFFFFFKAKKHLSVKGSNSFFVLFFLNKKNATGRSETLEWMCLKVPMGLIY